MDHTTQGGPGAVESPAGGGAVASGDGFPGAALLFEVAWEVCSQVGGIYTVLRSKAAEMVERWGEAYCLIGPYREASARIELEPQPAEGPMLEAVKDLAGKGIQVQFGRWLVAGRPRALLIDLVSFWPRLGEIKYGLWRDNGVSSPGGDNDFDEVVAFGYAVTEFFVSLQQHVGDRPLVAHFHEWQGGAAIPMMRHRGANVATIFTTHATLVGRSLSAANVDLYEHLWSIDAGAVANEHGFPHRHGLEGAAAAASDVFTTVSGITAMEAEQFLGRRADVLLPNGLNIERFAAPHEFQVLHRENRDRIHEFVMGHFFPTYRFDLDKTLYLFTSGRYEYRNKGIDLFIEALRELNRRMREAQAEETVVAFIVTRAPYRTFNVETLNRQAMLNEVRETCERLQHEMGQRLFHSVVSGRLPSYQELLGEGTEVRLKRMMYAMARPSMPTIVTHDLHDDGGDPVLNHLRNSALWNLPEDRVKVIFHPEFMTATSPLLGMDYDNFVRGCHLGVFPSYYEPWGYTPLECVVRGVPAVTSDLSGFGAYVMENFTNHDAEGMWVSRRRRMPFIDSVHQLAGWLHELTRMTRRQRIALRNRVESHADHFDWSNLGQYYIAAHRLALRRRFGIGDGGPAAQRETPKPAAAEQPATRRRARQAAEKRRTRPAPQTPQPSKRR